MSGRRLMPWTRAAMTEFEPSCGALRPDPLASQDAARGVHHISRRDRPNG